MTLRRSTVFRTIRCLRAEAQLQDQASSRRLRNSNQIIRRRPRLPSSSSPPRPIALLFGEIGSSLLLALYSLFEATRYNAPIPVHPVSEGRYDRAKYVRHPTRSHLEIDDESTVGRLTRNYIRSHNKSCDDR